MALISTIAVALLLHGIFTVGVPWAILTRTSALDWTQVDLGPARWIGLAIGLFGAYLYVWAIVRLLRRRTSAIPGRRPTELETDGWYRVVRHPLLLGVVAILVGEAALFESFVLLAYAALYWLWLHLFVILKEERDLREVFGEAYGAYCTEVPRWLPRFRLRR